MTKKQPKNKGSNRNRTTYKDWITEEGLALIEGWARDGLTQEQIAHNIGINPATVTQWKKERPKIAKALKDGKEVIDRKVENALIKRALGYEYTEQTKEPVYNKETDKQEMVVTREVTKHVEPHTTAQIFWLKNRKPEDWRDVHRIDANVNTNNPFKDLTVDELREIAGLEKPLE